MIKNLKYIINAGKMELILKSALLIMCFFISVRSLGQDPDLIRKAEEGDSASQLRVAWSMRDRKDYSDYVKWLTQSAENGNSTAQRELAERYAEGDCGVSKDYDLYRKWIFEAANNGDVNAMGDLAYSLAEGIRGFDKDDEVSVYWLTEAADKGDAVAQYCLASNYRYGKQGLDKDENLFLNWMKKSALNGFGPACFSLGSYYSDINKDEAVAWFKKAVDVEYNESGEKDSLSIEKLRGLGVEYHPKTAPKKDSASGSVRASSVSDKASKGNDTFPLEISRKYKIIKTILGEESRDFPNDNGYVVYENNEIFVDLGFATKRYVFRRSPDRESGSIYSAEVSCDNEDGKLSVIDTGKTITIEPIGLSFPIGYEVVK